MEAWLGLGEEGRGEMGQSWGGGREGEGWEGWKGLRGKWRVGGKGSGAGLLLLLGCLQSSGS